MNVLPKPPPEIVTEVWIDVTDIQPKVKLWKGYENVFMNYIQSSRNRKNTNIETNLLLRQQGIDREEFAKSLASGIADEEEHDDDSIAEEDKAEVEDKSPNEKIKPLIQSTVEYLIQHDKKELLDVVNEFRKDVDDDFLDTVLEL